MCSVIVNLLDFCNKRLDCILLFSGKQTRDEPGSVHWQGAALVSCCKDNNKLMVSVLCGEHSIHYK